MRFQTISAAAFSQRPPWKDDDATALPAGHQLTFRNALHTVLKKVFWKMALPAVSSTTYAILSAEQALVRFPSAKQETPTYRNCIYRA